MGRNKKTQSGFTLIELLVSISIIAILTSLLTVNFIGARQRGRDGQRKANLYNIQSALELYRSDNEQYPTTADFPTCGHALTNPTSGATYMQKVPCDPLSSATSYKYVAEPSAPSVCDNLVPGTPCTSFELYACLENTGDQDSNIDPDSKGVAGCDIPFKLTNP